MLFRSYEALDLKSDKEVWAMHTLRIIKNSKRKDYKNLIKKANYDIDKESKNLEKYYFLEVKKNAE